MLTAPKKKPNSKSKDKKSAYFDHAAGTYLSNQALAAMMPFFNKDFGNPSSLHSEGKKAEMGLKDSRRMAADLIGALPENIVFTSGGTESDNLAIYGIAKAHEKHGKHIISSPIEHHAVINSLEDLKKQGWEITYVQPDSKGFIKIGDIVKAIRPDTVLISLAYANNEIGTIYPIPEIGKQILQYRKTNNTIYPFFHTDACQAAGYLDLDVEKLHVDLMAISGSKIYGPKGVGMLYVRRGVTIKPQIMGGDQERGARSGTENTPGIAGLVKALELAQKNREKESARLEVLLKYLWEKIHKLIPDIRLNGPEIGPQRLPNNLNISFLDTEGEALLLYLDEYGIMCSTGSACAARTLEPSHVLKALGIPAVEARGAARFSLGMRNTKKDIDYLMKYLPATVKKLREISRMY